MAIFNSYVKLPEGKSQLPQVTTEKKPGEVALDLLNPHETHQISSTCSRPQAFTHLPDPFMLWKAQCLAFGSKMMQKVDSRGKRMADLTINKKCGVEKKNLEMDIARSRGVTNL